MYILLPMVLAPEFLHEKGVMYRDLLGRDGHVKLADYGMSRCDLPADGLTRTFCGTPEFMAPEAIDFWAFGVLLYQVFWKIEVRFMAITNEKHSKPL
jgi:serine/threonine protein kinase